MSDRQFLDEEVADASPAELVAKLVEIYKRMRSRAGGRWESRYNLATCSTTWTWRPDRAECRDGVVVPRDVEESFR